VTITDRRTKRDFATDSPDPAMPRPADRRHDDVREVAAWEKTRNVTKARVDWQFTGTDARVKLKRLFPTIQDR
jgi:hypothetical protein